ncbi:ABC transporter substrate-binding protein [Pseudooceanicola spongiae]|jgi:peptide/nickel transport system substrate-binding protein|uniref:Twin-arginine translocation signal domain-containing protein n=1 Tax=Pseudooceanicola spongiae TaxID=2613965 RepID=A0A7L9WJT5_9RHOB|nr:ABC transporter substrate-binding protein [Pseudooceanicola spongiae]QOL80489.1 twin-arginine translocation signal domain-containing protein [Pseudooceanicola spongiae]
MNDELRYMLARTVQGKMNRRNFLGRAAAVGLTAAAANTMLATGLKAQTPQKGGVLKIGMQGGGSTDSLDPALAANQVTFQLLKLFGDPLVELDPKGGPVQMRLAEAVESTPDAKQWTFKIRKGIKFHNGKDLTPDDVLATLKRHSDENSKSGALGVMQGIESMKVDGDNVVVSLTEANADLPYLMADYHLVIEPNGGMDDPASGIGTGAYKVMVNEPGVRYVFEKFDEYWDESQGHFAGVEILVINDNTARTSALQSGQIHVANRIDPKVAGLMGRAPSIDVKNVSGKGHYVFIMHCNTAPFDNNDLRLALKYAINRQEMVDKVLQGYGTIGNDFPINASYPLFDDSIEQRTYDPDKAAFHYKKSGHDGTPIVMRTSDVAFSGALDASALFQQTAKASGIPLEIKREPGDGYWSDVWNVQPFCASYWGGRPVQDQMYSTAYLSTADWNDTRFDNPAFDKLLVEAKGELDQAKRKEMYSQMAYMVRDEGGVILPMFNDFICAITTDVQGWVEDPNQDLMNGLVAHKCWFA